MEPHKVSIFKQSFADFISLSAWQWNWVAHQTFRPRIIDDVEQKLYPSLIAWSWHHFMRTIARDAMLNYGFFFAEKGKFGRLHWHAVLHVKENLFGNPRRTDVWEEMHDKFGRCRFEPYMGAHLGPAKRVSTGISNYLCKYVAKEVNTDNATWDFTGFMGGSTADSARIGRLIGIEQSDWPEIQEERST